MQLNVSHMHVSACIHTCVRPVLLAYGRLILIVLLVCACMYIRACMQLSVLQCKWQSRLQWLPDDTEIWGRVLSVRSLILKPEQVHYYLYMPIRVHIHRQLHLQLLLSLYIQSTFILYLQKRNVLLSITTRLPSKIGSCFGFTSLRMELSNTGERLQTSLVGSGIDAIGRTVDDPFTSGELPNPFLVLDLFVCVRSCDRAYLISICCILYCDVVTGHLLLAKAGVSEQEGGQFHSMRQHSEKIGGTHPYLIPDWHTQAENQCCSWLKQCSRFK